MLKNGHLSVTDEEWSESPSTSTAEKTVEESPAIILDNRWVATKCSNICSALLESSKTDVVS
jgi:hypothetical protein